MLTCLFCNLLLNVISEKCSETFLQSLCQYSFPSFNPYPHFNSFLGSFPVKKNRRQRRKLYKPHCNSMIPIVSTFAWNITKFFPRRHFSDLFSPSSLTLPTLGLKESVLISRDVIINYEVAKVISPFSMAVTQFWLLHRDCLSLWRKSQMWNCRQQPFPVNSHLCLGFFSWWI